MAHALKLLPDKGQSGLHFSFVLTQRDLRNPQIILTFYAFFFSCHPGRKPNRSESHLQAGSFLVPLATPGSLLYLGRGRGLRAATPLFHTVQPRGRITPQPRDWISLPS